jgi:hypothetical protein
MARIVQEHATNTGHDWWTIVHASDGVFGKTKIQK